MKTTTRRMQLELLESRDVPTLFGVPWADPSHLTLSFVPDGTALPGGASSDLFARMNAVAPTAVWEGEILRAFQTWAANANINVGLVTDSGAALGTPGAVQGDARFGDIRIAGGPTDGSEVAAASPFSWTGTTLAGDVVFGDGNPFAIGNVAGKYDVYSVALHEAGHVFGLDHSIDPASPMQEAYSYHSGLAASDVQHLQALYGARVSPAGDSGNDNFATATNLSSSLVGTQAVAIADITTNTDVDYFRFTAPITVGLTGVVLRVKTSGHSLLTASLSVYDANKIQLQTVASTNPLNNDLIVTLTNVRAGATYYVRVAGARSDALGIGAYGLVADFLLNGASPPALPALFSLVPIVDVHTNDTIGMATSLNGLTIKTDARFDAAIAAQISDSTDTDFYKVSVPKSVSDGAGGINLLVMVWALDLNGLNPRIRIYDQNKNPMAFQVLSNDQGLMSIQAPNAQLDEFLYIQVSTRDATDTAHRTGNYFLGADFSSMSQVSFDGLAAGTVAAASSEASDVLTIARGGLIQLGLGATSISGVADLTMTILDADGNVVGTLKSRTSQPMATRNVYLAAGTYTVQYSTAAVSGPLADVNFSLFATTISEGIGPTATSTSGGDPPPPPQDGSGYTYSGGSTQQPAGPGYWY